MPFCPACGDEVESDWQHCHHCGAELPDSAPTPQVETSEDQSTIPNDLARLAVIVGLGLTYLALAFPWFSVTIFGTSGSVSGFESAGVLGGIGSLLTLGLVVGVWSRRTQYWCVFSAGFAFLSTVLFAVDPTLAFTADAVQEMSQRQIQLTRAVISPGTGLMLNGLAQGLIFGGAFYGLTQPAPTPAISLGGSDSDDNKTATQRPSYHDLSPDRQHICAAVEQRLTNRPGSVLTERNIKGLYDHYPLGYDDADAWWADVEEMLREVEEIEPKDDRGIRWGLVED